jgi:tRNA threonylcarbamoyladenosine biosynthesis protein TsaB
MDEAGLAFAGLDAIAVTLGPGGFTGVRIGLAAAEGLALAWNLPILGLSSFAVVAGAIAPAEREGANLLLLLDAKRAEVYAQAEDARGRPLLEPRLIAPDRLAERLALQEGRWLLAGDAVDQAWPALAGQGALARASAPGHADAAVLARLAAALPLPDPRQRPQPIYLREPDTTGGPRLGPG